VVTIGGEATLAHWHRTLGGELTRIQVARARAVGGMLGWKSLAPVTQWAITKP
jgi:precorrin-6Y C5,15-methyltransferase (decarboxylating)